MLFEPIKAASRISDGCIVFFSGGKDSVVTLDLCARYFKRIYVVFMYLVPDLSFQEANLRWYENRYGIEIERVPHFMLSEFLRYGTFCRVDKSVPLVGIREIYAYVRNVSGLWWIAAGERIADSIVRRAMIKNSGSIDAKRGRFYPVAHWNKSEIMRYIETRRLKLAPEAVSLGHSFRSLEPEELFRVRRFYPDDYARIESWFPLIGAAVEKYRLKHEKN